MYRSALDAFEEVMAAKEDGCLGSVCRIRRISGDKARLENGIEYCFVEIACSNGNQYGIEAFGAEAIELRSKASATGSLGPLTHAIPMITV